MAEETVDDPEWMMEEIMESEGPIEETEEQQVEAEEKERFETDEDYYYRSSTDGDFDPDRRLWFDTFVHGTLTVRKDCSMYGIPVFVIEAEPDEGYELALLDAKDLSYRDAIMTEGEYFFVVLDHADMSLRITARFDESYCWETDKGGEYDPSGHFCIQSFEHGRLRIRNDFRSYRVPAYIIEAIPDEGYLNPVLDLTDSAWSYAESIIERRENYVAVNMNCTAHSVVHAVFEKKTLKISFSCWDKALQCYCNVSLRPGYTAGIGDAIQIWLFENPGYRINEKRVADEDDNLILEDTGGSFHQFVMPGSNVIITVDAG